MEKVHTFIEKQISRKKEGEIVFSSDFRGIGPDTAIKKALSRLTQEGIIKRLGHGIYYRPKMDSVIGEIRPAADDVIRQLAQREKIKIKPSGAYALHQLGLTTQVPMRRVYITDGHARQFTLGKLQIKFKPTTSKKLSRKGKISSLVIQALEELGTDSIDISTQEKIKYLLLKEDPRILKEDLKLSPVKVGNYIFKLLKDTK